MRKALTGLLVLSVAVAAMGQATKPKEPLTNKAIITAIIAMEKEYRLPVPAGLTSAQASAAAKGKEVKTKEILDALRAMPAGNVDFVVDDVIRHAPPTKNQETGGNRDPISQLNQALQDRDADRQMNDVLNGEYEIVGHIDWKSALIKSPDNRPVQKLRIFTSNQAVAKWKVSERHQLPVTCDSISTSLYNVKEEYVQASANGGSVQLKKVVDNSAAYVGITMKMREAPKP